MENLAGEVGECQAFDSVERAEVFEVLDQVEWSDPRPFALRYAKGSGKRSRRSCVETYQQPRFISPGGSYRLGSSQCPSFEEMSAPIDLRNGPF